MQQHCFWPGCRAASDRQCQQRRGGQRRHRGDAAGCGLALRGRDGRRFAGLVGRLSSRGSQFAVRVRGCEAALRAMRQRASWKTSHILPWRSGLCNDKRRNAHERCWHASSQVIENWTDLPTKGALQLMACHFWLTARASQTVLEHQSLAVPVRAPEGAVAAAQSRSQQKMRFGQQDFRRTHAAEPQ